MQLAFHWLRRDLRFEDNRALAAALGSGRSVVPVFIFDSAILAGLPRRDRRVSFIHAELARLQRELAKYGSSLLVRFGEPGQVWQQLAAEFAIDSVFAGEDYEPYARERDAAVAEILALRGIPFHRVRDSFIRAPAELATKTGGPFRVFTPYSRAWLAALDPADLAESGSESRLANLWQSRPLPIPGLAELGFEPADFTAPPREFDLALLQNYAATRDRVDLPGTSGLGIHLRFGTVSIRRLARLARDLSPVFLSELIWREFWQHVLWYFPETASRSFRPEFDTIWRDDPAALAAWQAGQTGFPLVDAAMRCYAATGWMHNRLRMLTANFLTKLLLLDWRLGERHFRNLLDFELASNIGNWQWAAGTGCDAAPYFRIFSPELQQQKFDPDLAFTRRWIPELDSASYPRPIIDYSAARARYLATTKLVKQPKN